MDLPTPPNSRKTTPGVKQGESSKKNQLWDKLRTEHELKPALAERDIWWPSDAKKADLINILQENGVSASEIPKCKSKEAPDYIRPKKSKDTKKPKKPQKPKDTEDGWSGLRIEHELKPALAERGIWWPNDAKKSDLINLLLENGVSSRDIEKSGSKKAPKYTKPKKSSRAVSWEQDEDDEDEHGDSEASDHSDERSHSVNKKGKSSNKSATKKGNKKSKKSGEAGVDDSEDTDDDQGGRKNTDKGREKGKDRSRNKSFLDVLDVEERDALDPADEKVWQSLQNSLKHLRDASDATKEAVIFWVPACTAESHNGFDRLIFFADETIKEYQEPAAQAKIISKYALHPEIWSRWYAGQKKSKNSELVGRWKEFKKSAQAIRLSASNEDVDMEQKSDEDTDSGSSHYQTEGEVSESSDVEESADDSSELSDPISEDDENPEVYDCKARRILRRKFHGKGKPEADRITIQDPDRRRSSIEADILGRHPVRRNWLALALPSNNADYPLISRGHYVDGTEDRYKDAFDRYVTEGSNIILSTAPSKKSSLNKAEPEEFELNVVLVMPWGKHYQTHAYGIPHFNRNRDFMLYSKSTLVLGWGSRDTEDVLRDHMIKAGQRLPRSIEKEIRAKSWRK